MGQQHRKVLLFKDLADEGYTEEGSRPRARHDGKRAVVKVPSLLFDIELEDSTAEEAKEEGDVHEVLKQLQSLAHPWSATELQLQDYVHKANAADESVKLDARQLAKKLEIPGFTLKVRNALGGGWSGDCLRQLRHFFITCIPHGSASQAVYLIDPCFREQFEIANPTARYSSILQEVPREFVGTEDRITSIVTILSTEIKRSFQETGATLPPWRLPSSMLSKWRPRRSEDLAVTPAKSTHHARVGYAMETKQSPPRHLQYKIDVAISSSADDVAATIAETGGSRALGPRFPHVCSPPMDAPHSAGKRSRGQGAGNGKYPSLLASKLRGVTTNYGPRPAAASGFCSSSTRIQA